MQYADLVNALGYYCQQSGSTAAPEFTASLSVFIQNAELRIYRELDFLSTGQQNASLKFTAGSRTLSLAGMTGVLVNGFPVFPAYPIVVQAVAAIIPSGDTPQAGVRVRFLPATVDFIDNAWPTEGTTSPPGFPFAYYAMLDHQTVIVAPTPDQPYTAEITGTWRPAVMSATNPETYLGDYLSDLLFNACMVEATGWMRDYGQQSDDPRFALSWEAKYQEAKKNAMEEEQRRKAQDPGWQPFQPTPLSGSPRT